MPVSEDVAEVLSVTALLNKPRIILFLFRKAYKTEIAENLVRLQHYFFVSVDQRIV